MSQARCRAGALARQRDGGVPRGPGGPPHQVRVLDGLLDPLGRCLDAESARRVAELRVSARVQQRIDTLAERANEGVLTSDEAAEYEAVGNAADFISILKLKARLYLDSQLH